VCGGGWGLTVSLVKSKSMVAGVGADTSGSVSSNHSGGRGNRLSGEVSVFGKHH